MQRSDDGQVVILFALFSLVLVGILALAVDTGYLLSERRETQAAVDAASLAGAVAMLNGASDSEIEATVDSYLLANGVDPDEATVHTVTPTGDENEGEVFVEIQRPVQRFFLGAVYTGPWETSAQATSAVEDGDPALYALLALDQDGDPIDIVGNADIDILGGGAMSNGRAACVGSGGLDAETTVDANRGFHEVGNCEFSGDEGKNPAAPIAEDPLADVPPPPQPAKPSAPGGNNVSCTPNNGGSGNNVAITCPAGRYTSDIQVTGNDGTVNFSGNSYRFSSGVDVKLTGNRPRVTFGSSAGNNIFYFEGGDLELTGNNPTATFWPGTYYFGRGGSFKLTGNEPTIEFKPGRYTFYMDESDLSFTGNSLAIYPDASEVYFYFKDADFTATGNANNTTIPPGIYHFDGGDIKMTGNSKIYGHDVFFFLENGAKWNVTGNSRYELTASETELYDGMLPGMLIYSDRDNETEFTYVGNSSTFMRGVIYLPAAKLSLTGNASGLWAEGQVIVNRFEATGNIHLDIQFRDYVDFAQPAVYLVE